MQKHPKLVASFLINLVLCKLFETIFDSKVLSMCLLSQLVESIDGGMVIQVVREGIHLPVYIYIVSIFSMQCHHVDHYVEGYHDNYDEYVHKMLENS